MTDVWTPEKGHGVYDFTTGTFTPDAPAAQAGAAPGDFGFGDDTGDTPPPAGTATAEAATAEASQAPADEPPVAEPQAGDPLIDEQPADQPEPEAEPVTPPTIGEVTQAAEELAMLDALKTWVSDELTQAKNRHKDGHAAYVNAGGNRAIPLRLPDGTEIGSWNIAETKTSLAWDDDAVLAYTTAHSPHNLYEIVDGETAARYDDVIEFIRLTHPELIRTAVRPAYLTLLERQLDADGNLVDETTGEVVKLGKRIKVESDGSGRPGWKRPKGKPDGRQELIAAWRRGEFKNNILEAPPVAGQGTDEGERS